MLGVHAWHTGHHWRIVPATRGSGALELELERRAAAAALTARPFP